MTREEIERSIAEISEALKKPGLSKLERRLYHEDRKDLRKLLEESKS